MLSVATLDPDVLRKALLAALKAWAQPDDAPSPLAALTLWQVAQQRATTSAHQATNDLLFTALAQLEQSDRAAADLLRARFLDNELTQNLAHQKNWSEATFFRKQNEALDQLTQVVGRMEQAARQARAAALRTRLEPPTYTQLFGVEPHLAHLTEVLHNPAGPWLLLIHGMGGMGKTALADALARHLLAQGLIGELGWITARQWDPLESTCRHASLSIL